MGQNDDTREGFPGRGAFGKFKTRLKELSERRNGVFMDILARIDQRKMDEIRQKMEPQEGDR